MLKQQVSLNASMQNMDLVFMQLQLLFRIGTAEQHGQEQRLLTEVASNYDECMRKKELAQGSGEKKMALSRLSG